MTWRTLLWSLVAIILQSHSVCAIEPDRREVIVAHNRVWDGYVYKENFVPSDQQTMVLLADHDNAVAMVRTEEYYWPLARQTYVALETMRDEIEGQLIVERNGVEVDVLEIANYSIVYPEGAINGLGYLIWGNEAEEEYVRYQRQEREFNRAFARARQAMTRYEIALKDAAAARLRGEGTQEVSAPPPLPEPSLKLVTKPQRAYRVSLPAGVYSSVLRVDGRDIPGSRKNLRVIDGTARDTLTADIIPEERWTRPLPSDQLSDRIYVAPGSKFYVTLSEASRFAEADYLPLVRPQATPVRGRDVFIRRKASDAETMRVAWLDDPAGSGVNREKLKVEQTGGAAFGYVIRTAETNETPDLEAFAIEIPKSANSGRGALEVATSDGIEFQREFVVVGERNTLLSVGLALLPILFGSWLSMSRRLSARRPNFR